MSASDSGSSLNFNSGMFGQNVGFNGFTFNSSVQTNNSRQTGISYQNSNTSTISAYPAPFNYGKGKYGSLPTFGGINSGNAAVDIIVNGGIVGTYNLVAELINAWDNGIGAWRELFSNVQEKIDNVCFDAFGMDSSQLLFVLGVSGWLDQAAVELNNIRTWSTLSKAANLPKTKFTIGKLQHEFSHAADFGIEGNWNNAKGIEYQNAIQYNINNATDIYISTYRGSDVYVYYNSNTGLGSYVDFSGNYIGVWKFSENQLNYHITNGFKIY